MQAAVDRAEVRVLPACHARVSDGARGRVRKDLGVFRKL